MDQEGGGRNHHLTGSCHCRAVPSPLTLSESFRWFALQFLVTHARPPDGGVPLPSDCFPTTTLLLLAFFWSYYNLSLGGGEAADNFLIE
jgi:hypothetical protein